MRRIRTQNGFTIIEMLVVLVIVLVAAIVIIQALSGYSQRQSLIGAAEKVSSLVEEAQSRTLSSVSSMQYGIHIEADKIILFSGSTYSSSDPNNEVHQLNDRVVAVASLSGGGDDIIFERLSGKTTQDGFVTVSLASDATELRVINIQETGIVSISLE